MASMKTRFEWQSDDQGDFVEATPDEGARPSWRRRGCLASLLALTAVCATLFAWQLNRKQSEAVASVKEEVILAYDLQQRAVESRDLELFSSLLSGSDLEWKRSQERLLETDLYNGRGALNLTGIPRSRTRLSLDLSPNLQQAEMVYVQEYEYSEGPGGAADLALRHTVFFRLEDGRWKQTAADRAYWGASDKEEGALAELTFPERDARLARELFARLEHHLEQVCAEAGDEQYYGSAFCTGVDPLRINLSTDDRSLLNHTGPPFAATSAFDYELPAPSLVGIPRDEGDIELYLDLYTRSVFQHMDRQLLSTVPYPDQDIYALCFKHPLNGRHLYRYDWQSRTWQPVLAAQAFEYLSALPDRSAIMLAGHNVLTLIDVDQQTASAEQTAVWQGNLPEVSSQSLVGWVGSGPASFQLVQQAANNGTLPDYSALDPDECVAHGCSLAALPGFPTAPEQGDAVLFQIGSEIVLESAALNVRRNLGAGFSPFWIDEETFGFVRFSGNADTAINTEVVQGSINGGGLKHLFDGTDLTREAGILFESVLFINEVLPNPVDPDRLLVSSTGIRDYAGRYFLFSADVSDPTAEAEIRLEVARNGSQGGVPGLLTPTGPPLFLFSSNGRWLAMTELNSEERETWTILVHDLAAGTTTEVSNSVPAMPGNYPLLDWSSDGQWLLVADRQFLHLIAPTYEMEELIAHDFDACSHIIWAG
ncbi:MAG: hypothetical protein ACK2UR_20660 [Candidatus Promineifilaceae bacterium]